MDDFQAILDKADAIIKLQIRKFYGIDGYDYEDLIQIGRIKVWKIVTDKNITLKNFDSFKGYISVSIGNLFGTELKKSKAQKRINLRESESLDAPIGNEGGDERDGYNFIPDKGGQITIETLETIKESAMKTRDKNAIRGVVWCLVELMNLRITQVPKKINYNTFIRYGLARYLWVFFNNSPFMALKFAYPEFKASDMKRRPNGYWKGKRGKKRAIDEFKEMLENSKYSEEEYPLVVNHDFISNLGLSAPLDVIFKGSPFLFLDAIFPGKYRPWMMTMTPLHYYDNDNNVIDATKWLIETILGFDVTNMTEKEIWKQQIGKKIGKRDFENHGLRGLLHKFGNSPEKIIRFVYPGKFQEWDLGDKKKWSRGKESLLLAAKATRWVIEEYSGLSPYSIHIGFRFFTENGLHGMITSKKLGLNSSPGAALKNAYPEGDFD